MSLFIKIILIGVAIAFYLFVYRALKGTRRGSRAAEFSVGGRKRREKDVADMDREERIRKRKVSLRSGGMFNRRR